MNRSDALALMELHTKNPALRQQYACSGSRDAGVREEVR